MQAGELDAVVGYELNASNSSVVTDIVDDTFVFIAAGELAGGMGPIALEEVLASPLVFYGEQSVSYRALRSAAASASLELTRSSSPRLFRRCVAIAADQGAGDEHRLRCGGERRVSPRRGRDPRNRRSADAQPHRHCRAGQHQVTNASDFTEYVRTLVSRVLVTIGRICALVQPHDS